MGKTPTPVVNAYPRSKMFPLGNLPMLKLVFKDYL